MSPDPEQTIQTNRSGRRAAQARDGRLHKAQAQTEPINTTATIREMVLRRAAELKNRLPAEDAATIASLIRLANSTGVKP